MINVEGKKKNIIIFLYILKAQIKTKIFLKYRRRVLKKNNVEDLPKKCNYVICCSYSN